MSQLSSYPNVYNTCLVLLQKRGFALRYERANEDWFAEKAGFAFRADNPIALLGLVAIYDEKRPTTGTEYWWKIDEPNLLSQLDPES